ncbi:hypothetical protein CcCBS67573_g09894 [Chytriomyces confervae]|uniref:Uncharacterized protein n=1 Tax=Chytriomyces confervae TaxID=246404 RepID=A0A507DL30_9FUNG|nr:hypothetical protein CcCBS67573_g09894 [Chytriomyces confervae]
MTTVDESERWWIDGMSRLHSLFRSYRRKLPKALQKEGDDDDDSSHKLDAFVEAVCTYQFLLTLPPRPISYSLFGTGIQIYVVYVAFSRASFCLTLSLHDSPLSWLQYLSKWIIWSLQLAQNANPISLFYCPSRQPTFFFMCCCIQLAYYSAVLAIRLLPANAFQKYPLLRTIDVFLHTYALPIVSAAVFLPVFLIPGSRTSFQPLRDAFAASSATLDVLATTKVASIWNLYGVFRWFQTSELSNTKLIVPGLTAGTRALSFWGSWIFGRPYSGAIFLWWLFQVCNRSAVGLYNWEADQHVASVDETLSNSEPMPDDFDGRIGGGRYVGWCRRMWFRFGGMLVWTMWQCVQFWNGPMGESSAIRIAGGAAVAKYFVSWDADAWNFPGVVWMWIGVGGSGVALSVWINFLNYQHRLLVWEDASRTKGVVIDEEDDEMKLGILF